ncbi:MAG: hypothetical protein KKB31_07220, partial [Nanoarchaeota archaeon]|nr:hypothetical protein [Nanoarchaeota archaeon]
MTFGIFDFDTSVSGTDLNITSQAQGDILYFNGSEWVRLGAGTSGKFLKTLGAGANPSWDTVAGSSDDPLVREVAEHEIEIIELQANASLTPFDHDTLISDTFSDTTGYNNLVNIGNTTAIFDTNKYSNQSYVE